MKSFAFFAVFILTSCAQIQQNGLQFIDRDFVELPQTNISQIEKVTAAFKNSCIVFNKKPAYEMLHENSVYGTYGDWQKICDLVKKAKAKQLPFLLKKHFDIFELKDETKGLFTGYYQPVMQGSLTQTDLYKYPLYTLPDDLLTADLSQFNKGLANKKLVGRVVGKQFVPYHSREEMFKAEAKPLVWLKSPVDGFFLHIQGSGSINLQSGGIMHVAYAGNNGHTYYAIGKKLRDMGVLPAGKITMQSIRTWLENNPNQMMEVFHTNPRYIFFKKSFTVAPGSLQVPLTPEASLAVDPVHIPLGIPLFLASTLTFNSEPFHRIMVAQDTGSAIKGGVRGDIFFGSGYAAEIKAGAQNSAGRLFVFVPKPQK